MVLRRHVLSEFICRKAGNVDFPSETRLNLPKRRRELSQADSTDDKQVHVAERMFLATSDRTVHKRTVDLASERLQGLSQGRQEPGSLFEETAEFGEQGRSRFGLEVAPGAFATLFQNAAIDEGLEFSLQARGRRSDELCQF
jgi:hypothetical protein